MKSRTVSNSLHRRPCPRRRDEHGTAAWRILLLIALLMGTAAGTGLFFKHVFADPAVSVQVQVPGTNDAGALTLKMIQPRWGHWAMTLPDGRIAISGGYTKSETGETVEATTVEVFDPATGAFSEYTDILPDIPADQSASQNTVALKNGGTLVFDQNSVSVTWDDIDVLHTFTYEPGTDADGNPTLVATPADVTIPSDANFAALARGNASATLLSQTSIYDTGNSDLPSYNRVLVVGGQDAGDQPLDAAIFNPARLATDKNDYHPGEVVWLGGSGWKPGEEVDIYVVDDLGWHYETTLTADTSGKFPFDHPLFDVTEQHAGAKFELTAIGVDSELVATVKFTDSVTVTTATGGTNISADRAANAASAAYTPLGDIVITESANNEFPVQANTTLILTAPTGWAFNPGVGSTSTTKSGAGANELSDNSITVTASTITVNISVTGTSQINSLSIKGIQVRATDGANIPASGNITRTGGTATVTGFANGTSAGSLSQVPGGVSKLVVTFPGQTFTDATTVAGSGNTGSVTAQTAGTPFNIRITATDQFFNVVTSYTGSKTISYGGPGSNPGFSPSYTTPVTFASGVATGLATTLTKAETTTISVSDGVLGGPVSSSITVNVGSLASFLVTSTGGGAIATQTAGTPFNIAIRAIDAGGNTATSFSGKVMVTPSSGTLSSGGGNSSSFTLGILSPWSVTFSTSGSYPGSYTLTATQVGGGGSPPTGTSASFTVNPANTPPVANNDAYPVNEDTPLTITAPGVLSNDTDAENNTLTAVLVTGPSHAASFALNSNGSFSYTPAANYNGPDSFTYNANDGTVNSTSPATVSITVNAVNDAPTATNLSAPETYTEDTPLNLVDIVVSDIDSTSVTATLTLSTTSAGSLSTGTSGAVTSTYNSGTGVWTASGAIASVNALLAGVTFNPALNFNANFTIATSVSDGVAAAITGSKAMTGIAVNDAPVLDATKNPALVAEDEDAPAPVGAVGTLVSALVDFAGPVANVTDADSGAQLGIAIFAADASNGSWSYSTDNGANWTALGAPSVSTSRLLAANAGNRLYFKPNLNFNGAIPSAITFRAWDQTTGTDGLTADTTVNGGTTAYSTVSDTASLTINAVNDPPVITSDGGLATASINVAENTTAVTTVTATDVDLPAQTLTFSIVGGDDHSLFSIGSSSGVLTFNTAPNFESRTDANSDGVYEVTVQVSDGSLTDQQAISVMVIDANDAPTDIALNNSSVAENKPSGTLVGTFSTTDEDPGDTHTYLLVSGTGSDDNLSFSISGNQLLTAASFDYETKNSYSVRVRSTDSGTGHLFFEKAFTITIINFQATVSIAAINDGAEAPIPVNGKFTVTQTAPNAYNTVLGYIVTGSASPGNDYTTLSGTVTIVAGQTTADIDVSVKNDKLLEGTETVTVTLSTPVDPDITLDPNPANTAATLNITDDESATLNIASTSSATEAGGAQPVGQVTLTITGTGSGSYALGSGINLTADVSDAGGGSATSGSDYSFSTQGVTFDGGAAGGATRTVTLTTLEDTLLEGAETVNLALGNLGGSAVSKFLGTTANTTTISDNESATLAIEATSSATEAGGAQQVGQVTLTITGTGSGTFALGSGISVTASVTDAGGGTATSPADYSLSGTSLTFDSGAQSGATRAVTLTAVDDKLLEGGETVNLTLGNLGGSTVNRALGATANTTTISDNESATLDIEATSTVTEEGGAQAAGVVTLTITGSGTGAAFALGAGISLTADISDAGGGSAIVVTDYDTFGTQGITFDSGALSGATRNRTITPVNDGIVEGDETINLHLANLNGSSVTKNLGNTDNITTISDNDSATIYITKIKDGAEGVVPTNGKFRVIQTAVSSTDTTVTYNTAGSTATAPGDYTALSGSVTIPAGATYKDIYVTVQNDTLLEGSETVVVNLLGFTDGDPQITLDSNPDNLTATVNITDDESATLAIASTSSATEAGGAQQVGQVTLTITGTGSGTFALGSGISLTADVVDAGGGTASSGADYTAFGIQGVTFNSPAASGATRAVSLTPVSDLLLEGDETVKLTLQNLGNSSSVSASLGNTANTTTITDDESATLDIAATKTVTETGGAQNIGVTLTITGTGTGTLALGTGITLTADVVDAGTGSATSGTDYSSFGTQTVTFNPGATSGSIYNVSLSPVNDKLLEGDETVDLTLQNLGNSSSVSASLGNTANTTTITDDESATLAIAATSSVTENGGAQNIDVTLTIGGSGIGTFALGSGITLTADVADAGTGTASSADYDSFGTQTVTFNPGATTGSIKNVSLSPVNDKLLEGNETVDLTLQNLGNSSSVSASLGNAANTTTITDDESAKLDIEATSTVPEDGLSHAAGVVTLTITGSGTGTYALGAGISLTADISDAGGGSAIVVTDYDTFGTQGITFDAGATTGATRSGTIKPVDDTIVEGDETVNLQLSNLGGSGGVNVAKSLGNEDNITTITDTDTATVYITKTKDGAEGVVPTNGKFRVIQTAVSSTDTTVTYNTVGSTATAPGDYTALSGSVTIPAGATYKDIYVTVANDTLLEGTETVVVNLLGFTDGDPQITLDSNPDNLTATVNITDDESATLAIASTSSATEAGGAQQVGQVTLTITGTGSGTFALGSAISLTADVVDAGGGTASSGADYTAFGTKGVTFNSGAADGTTKTVTLTTLEDSLLEGSETVKLTLQNLGKPATVACSLGNGANTTTISDNESATLAIATTSTAPEAAGAKSIGVTLNITGTGAGPFALGSGITLKADVVDAGTGTASSADYSAFGTQTVTFNPGTTSGSIENVSLLPVNDTLLEADETVNLTLQHLQKLGGSYVSASLGNTANTTTITDDESATLDIDATSTVTEFGGAQPAGVVTLTITGTPAGTFALGSGISITASVTDAGGGSALSGTDYSAFGTQGVTFDSGAASGATRSPMLTPVNDPIVEDDETVNLSLGSLNKPATVAASLGNTANITTITDNDTATVSIAKSNDGAEAGPVNGKFCVTQTAVSSTDTTVYYSVSGTATSGSDYTALSGSVKILAGSTKADIYVPVQNDTLLEGTETVIATLTGFGAHDPQITLDALPANRTATVNITDDESATLAIVLTSSATEPGGAQTVGIVTMTITGTGSGTYALGPLITVCADVVDAGSGTATSGSDYTAFGTQKVTFNGGAVSGATQNTTLTTINDTLLEGSETVKLTLQNLGGSPVTKGLGNTANCTTISDDESATLAIEGISTVTENGGGQSAGKVTLTITGSGSGTYALGAGITLSAQVIDAGGGSAVNGTDYQAFGTQSVSFTGGTSTGSTQSPTLTPINNGAADGNRTVNLQLQNLGKPANVAVTAVSLGNTANVTTILDDDTAVAVGTLSAQYSDTVDFSATIKSGNPGSQLSGTVYFSIFDGTSWVQYASATVNGTSPVTVTATSSQILLAPNTYNYKADFDSSNSLSDSSGSSTIKINQENARATYNGLMLFGASSINATTMTITLSATIQDITALFGDPLYDANSGDIQHAKVAFVDRDNGNAVLVDNLTPTLINPADKKTGLVSGQYTVTFGPNVDSVTLHVGIIVSSYYTDNNSVEDTEITVSKPIPGSITGGGYTVNQSSSGQYAATAGSKFNFGFNVKNNKTGKNLQGQANLIFRRLLSDGWHCYQIKTTATDSLAEVLNSNGVGGIASFSSKANLTDVTNPLLPSTVLSGLLLNVAIHDNGEPGNTDTVGVTLWNGTGTALLFSNNWVGGKTVEQQLGNGNGGGNLVTR